MKLRDVRRERGIPQYRLAGLASVPQSEIYRMERRGMRPTPGQAKRLADVLEVAPGDVEELRTVSPVREPRERAS